MITISFIKSAGGAADYFAKAFDVEAKREADNYSVNEMASAQWRGKGAELLGLHGKEVSRKDFTALLQGHVQNPWTGEIQRLDVNPKKRREGFDLHFAPPKSVSLVALVGGDERVVRAHERAVEVTMRGFEDYAAIARVKVGGQANVLRTGNLVWATIVHESNRSNEPQLHSHNVVPAVTFDPVAGKWRSITNDVFLKIRTEMDARYKAALSADLKTLGYQLRTDKTAGFEIAGIAKEQLKGFSGRSAQIDDMLVQWGINPEQANYAQRQAAGLATRDDKTELSRAQLDAVWQARASELGLDLKIVVDQARNATAVLQQTQTQDRIEPGVSPREDPNPSRPAIDFKAPDLSPESRQQAIESILNQRQGKAPEHELARKDALRVVQWAALHLSEREQVFERKDVLTAAQKFGMGKGVGPDAAEWALNELISKEIVLEYVEDGKVLVMMRSALDQEVQLLKAAQALRDHHNPIVADANEFQALREKYEEKESLQRGTQFRLSAEQVTTAKDLLMHPDAIQGVQGGAGTGKTASIKFAAMVAGEKGMVVMGMATTSSAAAKLQESSGITSNTVAAFNIEREELVASKKLQLAQLQERIERDQRLIGSDLARIDVAKLSVSMPGKNFGKSRYVFDHEAGTVFRIERGLRNSLGGWVLEKSLQAGRFGLGTQEHDRGLPQQMAIKVSNIGKRAARSMVRYEIADAAEGVEARNAILLKRNQDVVAFGRISAELDNLSKTGNTEGKQFIFVLDEASMTGTKDTLAILQTAKELNARVVIQGDVNQHHSISAGRSMQQLKDLGVNFNHLSETYRFKNANEKTKSAVEMLTLGAYADGFARLPYIQYSGDLEQVAGEQFTIKLNELKEKGIANPSVGVVVLTNEDRKNISYAVHEALAQKGYVEKHSLRFDHFDMSNLTTVQKKFVSEIVQWRNETKKDFIPEKGVELYAIFNKAYPKKGINKDDVIKISGFDINKNVLSGQSETTGKTVNFNPTIEDFFSLGRREWREYAVGDKVVARHIVELHEGQFQKPDSSMTKQAMKDLTRIKNGTPGRVVGVSNDGATIEWIDGRSITLDAKQMRMVDWAYARTTIKEQGNENHVEMFALSHTGNHILKDRAAYVAGTRGKIDTVLITPDRDATLNAVRREDVKTTALDIQPGRSIDDAIGQAWQKISEHRGHTLDSRSIQISESLTPTKNLPVRERNIGRSR